MADLQIWKASSLLKTLLTKRRTWVALFAVVFALLVSFSWNLLLSIRSWYYSTASANSPFWPALYASLLFGAVFGLLSVAAALSIAVPATLVTWITVLVLLAFAGKPRRSLVAGAHRITADITGVSLKILLKEGNLVAAACALLSFLALLRRRDDD